MEMPEQEDRDSQQCCEHAQCCELAQSLLEERLEVTAESYEPFYRTIKVLDNNSDAVYIVTLEALTLRWKRISKGQIDIIYKRTKHQRLCASRPRSERHAD